MTPGPTTLGIGDAVALAQALVDFGAEARGVRALAIKGPQLARHGLRAERASSDADVLVEPGGATAMEDFLAAAGWRRRYERPDQPHILGPHSVTLLHPRWPCDIDLHTRYPGIFADDTRAFDLLWDHRESFELAGRTVQGLDLPAAALIVGLHGARHPSSPRHRAELESVAARLRAVPGAADAMHALGAQLRALEPLQPLTTLLGAEPLDPAPVDQLSAAERRQWQILRATHDSGSLGAWLVELTGARWRDRPRLVLRALVVPRSELSALRTDGRPVTIAESAAHHLGRLRRGLASLPGAVAALRRSPGRHLERSDADR